MRTITILIAEDDDSDFADLQKEFGLLRLTYHLQRVKNGKLLLQFLSGLVNYRLKYPDLIVMNLEMPEVNGMETLELIKVNSYFSNIPVLIYTASVDSEQEEKCRSLGAATYIKKGRSVEEVRTFTYCIHDYISHNISNHGNDNNRNIFSDQFSF